MDLSILIVSWNAKEYLHKCLRSTTDEISPYHSEIIVVDNASTDGSQEMVKKHFPGVKLICNNANLGFAKANNIGLKQCKGKYICLVNSDIEILPRCIDLMLVYMNQHPEVGMLGPKILNPDGTLQPSCMGFPTLWNSFCRAFALDSIFPNTKLFGQQLMTFLSYDSINDAEVLNGCFLMVRREALDQVGPLDEDFFIYSEDKDWCKRFWEARWKVVNFPEAQAIHYGGASSANAPIRFSIEMLRANLQYWKKHHGRIAQICFRLIVLMHHNVRILGQVVLFIIMPSRRIQAKFKVKRSMACLRWLLNISVSPEILDRSVSEKK